MFLPALLCCTYDQLVSCVKHTSLSLVGCCEDSNGQPAPVIMHFLSHNPVEDIYRTRMNPAECTH